MNSKLKKHIPLIALCLGFFMVIVDIGIVNVALPTLAKSLSGNVSWLQWVVDGYTLTFACLLLSAGNIGDKFGAKSGFLWGLVIFIVTSIGCGLANNFLILTFFRLLQGIGAALLVPTSLALINASYKIPDERSRAIMIWAMFGGFAGAAGPVLGAFLTAWFSWRAVFFINVPIGIISFVLTFFSVVNPINNEKTSFDFLGQILAVITIAALAFSLIEAGRFGWLSEYVVISFVIFILGLIAFIFVEKNDLHPMLPLNLFHSKMFSAALLIGMMLNIGAYGELFVLPLYFQKIKNFSVIETGLAIIPYFGLGVLGSYVGGSLTRLFGPRLPIMVGMLIGALGFLLLLIVNANISYLYLLIPLALVGFGAPMVMPAATISIMHAVPAKKAGIASGVFNAARQTGSLLGVAIFGTMLLVAPNFITGMRITV